MAKYMINKNVASFKAGDIIERDKLPVALEAHVTKMKEEEKLEVATPKASSKVSSKSTK